MHLDWNWLLLSKMHNQVNFLLPVHIGCNLSELDHSPFCPKNQWSLARNGIHLILACQSRKLCMHIQRSLTSDPNLWEILRLDPSWGHYNCKWAFFSRAPPKPYCQWPKSYKVLLGRWVTFIYSHFLGKWLQFWELRCLLICLMLP